MTIHPSVPRARIDLALSRRTLLRLAAAGAGTYGLTTLEAGSSAAAPPGPAGTATPSSTPVKTRATYYTPEKVAAARANVAALAWAAAMRDEAVAGAQPLVDAGEDWLWRSITSQGLPRSYAVNQDLGSPVTGEEIFEYGNYPWLADPYARPWKLEDPSSGYLFPTNDFAAFYASALDEHGNFQRELGDPAHLVNTLYPERGPTWGVDDGWGWIDDDGAKWTFCAYYAHWFGWYGPPADVNGVKQTSLRQGLMRLRDSYLLTGDAQYARLGVILLDRFADLYPAMDTSVYPRAEGYLHSDGLRGVGKAVGCIWESGLTRTLVECYDAFYPVIAETDDAGVVEYLSARSDEYGLAPKATVADIRANIENGILRQVFPAVQDTSIFGNFGMHQATLAMTAVVLDEPASAAEWLDFLFAAGGLTGSAGSWRNTGGNIGPTLVDQVDRDGWYGEGAPGYNILPISNLQSVADALAGYDTYPAADLYEHPKYAAMFAGRPGLTMLGAYTPSIGDSGQTGKPYLLGLATQYVAAFERYDRAVDAQMAHRMNGDSTDGLRGDVFSADAARITERIQAVIDTEGPLDLPSENLTGFGLAAHRTGTGAHARGLTTFYGTNRLHGHRNGLALGLFAHGLDLAPGLGYPEFADNNARRREWESNTVASATVVVDATPHATQVVGRPLAFRSGGDGVHLTDVEAPAAYPDASRYRRTSMLVDVDDERSYVLDLFRVHGGSEHVFSFHAAEGPATADGVTLAAQPTGTYAGPDVEPPNPTGPARPGASGFDWLTRVERGTPSGAFSVDWDITDTYGVHEVDPDVHVRLTMLTPVAEVALADGIPPRNKPGNPASLRFMLAKRSGEGLRSTFTSVIEPYVDSPVVADVRALPVTSPDGGAVDADDVTAVAVTLADGRVDWLVHDAAGGRRLEVDGRIVVDGAFALVRFDASGRPERAVGHDAVEVREGSRVLVRPRGGATGIVTGRTAELAASSTLVVELDAPMDDADAQSFVGRCVYVEDDGVRNAVYRVTAARCSGRRLELDVPTTFVRSYVRAANPDAGFRYDVEPGRTVQIPADGAWTR
ncbi:heparinase II/III domain-containing protein [Krasilnikoviella flava]|uniref:Heparinase II/III-like protein n=1 Tax=Krasilnikoviella flava TaxID=526729 RepID=A0A1T5LA13_9MICO|nr:heparinase II/III family protein [Krasilnikoviella flava]SKC72793.1 Heparinase II/III-like protein [Krasilnikoviella flava]